MVFLNIFVSLKYARELEAKMKSEHLTKQEFIFETSFILFYFFGTC